MEPKIVSKAQFSVVGMKIRAQGGSLEMPRLWDTLMPRAHEIVGKTDAAYGVIANFDEAKGQFDYLAGFEVEGAHEPPSGMISQDLPAQKYAVFPCTLPTIMQVIDQAVHHWLPSSSYRRADGPEFEFYGPEFDSANPDSPMAIYIPLRPR